MSLELDFLAAIRRESSRFTECLTRVSATVPVPSCPGWTAADLLWHLAEVQLFWGAIVRERLDNPEAAEATKPPRPAGYEALQVLARRATAELLETLASTPAPTRLWTWATDHTAGFVLRRQAHEALIHRLDAELAVGEVTSFDPALAADGVDEALRVMYGTAPEWGSLTPDGPAGRLLATDVGMAWQVGFVAATSGSQASGMFPASSMTISNDLGIPIPAMSR